MDKHVLYFCAKRFDVIWCNLCRYLNLSEVQSYLLHLSADQNAAFSLVCYVLLLTYLHDTGHANMLIMFCAFSTKDISYLSQMVQAHLEKQFFYLS